MREDQHIPGFFASRQESQKTVGWLDWDTFQPLVDKAWNAILARTASDGRLLDVYESTYKQGSLNDYLRRAAIFDGAPRGGAMALMFALEVAGL